MQFRWSRALPAPFSSALRLGRAVLPALPERGRGERKAELLLIPEGLQPSHSAHSKGSEQSELGHLLAEPLPSWSQSAGGALQTRTQLKYTHGNKSRTQRISLRIISINRYIVRIFLFVMLLWIGEFLKSFKVACCFKLSFMSHA